MRKLLREILTVGATMAAAFCLLAALPATAMAQDPPDPDLCFKCFGYFDEVGCDPGEHMDVDASIAIGTWSGTKHGDSCVNYGCTTAIQFGEHEDYHASFSASIDRASKAFEDGSDGALLRALREDRDIQFNAGRVAIHVFDRSSGMVSMSHALSKQQAARITEFLKSEAETELR